MIPKYLYHYTSVENFKLIIKNQTIRFKRIDLLNDPLEANLKSFTNFRKFVFTSSWTANEIDEIPMWKMYCNLEGVRFRMPIDLFTNEKGLQIEKDEDSFNLISELENPYYLDVKQLKEEKKFKVNKIIGPAKIIYDQNFNDLENSTIKSEYTKNKETENFIMNEINFRLMGLKKSNFWQFENEYRFRILPFDKIKGSETVLNSNIINMKSEYIDIKFNQSALGNIEILFGPKTNDNDIIDIDFFFKK